MAKSRALSIYLLKPGEDATTALETGHTLDSGFTGTKLPDGSSLFVADKPAAPPWWKKFLGITGALNQTLKAAILFVEASDRTFAITFGHVHHNLKDMSYEHNFGLLVTLNSIDPNKLKSTDSLDPNGAKRQRTQLPIDSDLTYFDFDRDSTILKSLTGKVKATYGDWFRNATGASNIRISSKVGPEALVDLCEELFKLYTSNDYLAVPDFKGLQNIAPVTDPNMIGQLDQVLIDKLREGSTEVQLCIPDMVDYRSDDLWITFTGVGTGKVYEDVTIENYYSYLTTRGVSRASIDVPMLKKHRLALTDMDGFEKGERFSVFKSLIFEVQLATPVGTFYLCEGKWYQVDADFVRGLAGYLDPFFEASTLPPFLHDDEGDYNAKVATALQSACLDKTNIAPNGQNQVEPCDILEMRNGMGVLHHIKIATRSGSLSHLFNQGANSILLLRDEAESRTKFQHLITTHAPAGIRSGLAAALEADKMIVRFGIITSKDPAKKSDNLPLFSRISLRRTLKDLHRLRIDAKVCYIGDNSPPKVGTKKKKKAAKKSAKKTVKKAGTKKAAKKSTT